MRTKILFLFCAFVTALKPMAVAKTDHGTLRLAGQVAHRLDIVITRSEARLTVDPELEPQLKVYAQETTDRRPASTPSMRRLEHREVFTSSVRLIIEAP